MQDEHISTSTCIKYIWCRHRGLRTFANPLSVPQNDIFNHGLSGEGEVIGFTCGDNDLGIVW
ncbi:hypothetical protein DCAR_0831318 [Daucus carota subsp. sativus]|uniref:Uncharacterized protein n=1 Tax=Daucus carota subsp. sativus TaxID=79200 RepID=A0A175YML1_DAUCS|nr:hypothetical protein DCAR_0831318 [Daucus carota subsp. sativus]